MTKYKVGDVVSVDFPFTDLQGRKRRPGLVLVSGEIDLLVARITTRAPRDSSDVLLDHWSEIGLPRRSTVRLTKLATIDERLVYRAIGHLNAADANAVAESWQRLSRSIVAELQRSTSSSRATPSGGPT